jgi:S-adenosylmethionine decarboxylase proenzyme
MPERSEPMLYVADLHGCGALTTITPDTLSEAFVTALERAGATVVDKVSHVFPHAGQTCVLILAESHAVLHTWPETGTVHIDVFSCTPRLKSLSAIEEMAQLLGAGDFSVRETPRANGFPQTVLTTC